LDRGYSYETEWALIKLFKQELDIILKLNKY